MSPKPKRGDLVKIIDGVFAGLDARVIAVLEKIESVRVETTIDWRPVPIELQFRQVKVKRDTDGESFSIAPRRRLELSR